MAAEKVVFGEKRKNIDTACVQLSGNAKLFDYSVLRGVLVHVEEFITPRVLKNQLQIKKSLLPVFQAFQRF